MKIESLFCRFLTFFTILCLLADSIGSDKTIQSRFGISSSLVLLLSWLVIGILRLKRNCDIKSKKFELVILVSALLSFLATGFLSVWDYLTPVNYVYSVTRIQQQQLGLVSVFLIGLFFIYKGRLWWKNNYKKTMFFTPLGLILGLMVVRLWPRNYFLEIVKEDHLIENLQVYLIGIGLMVIGRMIYLGGKNLKKWEKILMSIIILGFVLLLGDEISWGQRIFHISTPELMLKINRQKELTIHNLYSIEWMVQRGYIIIGLLGGSIWMVKKRLLKLSTHFRWLIPSSYLIYFFVLPGLYNIYPLVLGENLIREWSEVMELLLYSGMVIHVTEVVYVRCLGKKVFSFAK